MPPSVHLDCYLAALWSLVAPRACSGLQPPWKNSAGHDMGKKRPTVGACRGRVEGEYMASTRGKQEVEVLCRGGRRRRRSGEEEASSSRIRFFLWNCSRIGLETCSVRETSWAFYQMARFWTISATRSPEQQPRKRCLSAVSVTTGTAEQILCVHDSDSMAGSVKMLWGLVASWVILFSNCTLFPFFSGCLSK